MPLEAEEIRDSGQGDTIRKPAQVWAMSGL